MRRNLAVLSVLVWGLSVGLAGGQASEGIHPEVESARYLAAMPNGLVTFNCHRIALWREFDEEAHPLDTLESEECFRPVDLLGHSITVYPEVREDLGKGSGEIPEGAEIIALRDGLYMVRRSSSGFMLRGRPRDGVHVVAESAVEDGVTLLDHVLDRASSYRDPAPGCACVDDPPLPLEDGRAAWARCGAVFLVSPVGWEPSGSERVLTCRNDCGARLYPSADGRLALVTCGGGQVAILDPEGESPVRETDLEDLQAQLMQQSRGVGSEEERSPEVVNAWMAREGWLAKLEFPDGGERVLRLETGGGWKLWEGTGMESMISFVGGEGGPSCVSLRDRPRMLCSVEGRWRLHD